jgi:hypothetical protein
MIVRVVLLVTVVHNFKPPPFFFISGWDQGLLGACVGEKRKLKIPAKLGYGDQGSPPTIPGNIFSLILLQYKSIASWYN